MKTLAANPDAMTALQAWAQENPTLAIGAMALALIFAAPRLARVFGL